MSVRGRVVLTVVLVTACLYSLLGTVGFLYIASSGRDTIRERVSTVVDQLETGLRNGTGAVSIVTADGVEAVATLPGELPTIPSDDVSVIRTVSIGGQTLDLVGHASQAPLTDSLRSLFRGLWIGVPLGVLLTAAVAWLAIRRALRPVSVITDLAATIDATDVSSRVPVPDTDDEIEHLARTVNEMLDRIAAGQMAQRRFTSDAAHELRTPLMALQGEIELALNAGDRPDAGFLHRVDALGNRLARRVDDLVLLSTLDEQPPLVRRPANLLDIARTEASTVSGGDGAPVIEIVGDGASAVVDERLAARAVRNLLANASRHARTRVRVVADTADERVSLTVDDDGPGVAPADREVILSRFGRLDEARHADSGGAGLGLAIVVSVAHAHGGDVIIGNADLGGARFTLWFPVRTGEEQQRPQQPGVSPTAEVAGVSA
ncbi:MAG: ATP-binding region, ATPase domain protein [Ilumatobacteraceae bacterium]|nr:ATP-binding region, ATPase domain protein [Ilumatobacteraceae bacterium]